MKFNYLVNEGVLSIRSARFANSIYYRLHENFDTRVAHARLICWKRYKYFANFTRNLSNVWTEFLSKEFSTVYLTKYLRK